MAERAPWSRLRNRRGWGVGASLALHGVLLTVLALGVVSRAPPPQTRPIEVQLVRIPRIRPLSIPRPTRAPAAPAPGPPVRPPPVPPLTPSLRAAPPAAPPPAILAGDGNDLTGAVFDQRDPTHRSLRATVDCARRNPLTLTEREWKGCGFSGHYGESPAVAALSANPEEAAALQRAAQANQAWRTYKDSRRLDDYPGLAAALGKDH
jgi:hypothetical protein